MRGNMFVYPWNGKYIHDFIQEKSDPKKADALKAFNISVGFDRNFRTKDSKLLFEIARATWATGDPGIVFLDRVNRDVPIFSTKEKVMTLVPCGEQGMYNGEYCTLGSINLHSEFLKNSDGTICFDKLKQAVSNSVDFLDSAVDETVEFSGYRRIGLGVLGWADYLDSLSITYGSDESIEIAQKLSRHIGGSARERSTIRALQKGAFPRFYPGNFVVNEKFCHDDIQSGFSPEIVKARKKYGMRNISVTCLPPTGGITLITENSGFAIEPFFHEATKITPYVHLRMLNAWQTGMCNSVSKTIGLHTSATVDDVFCLYLTLFHNFPRVKSISVYRDDSRNSQPLTM
jgi:ribonucleoside-diphosphate reductase alpha chain